MTILLVISLLTVLANNGVSPQDTLKVRHHTDSLVKIHAEEADVIFPEKEPAHFLFKGIPIDGTLDRFGKALEAEGYKRLSAVSYIGTYAGIGNSHVLPYEDAGNVWMVSVLLPARATWGAVKEEYLRFKTRFAYKYVVSPAVEREHLSSKYREGSGMEMWGFENGSSIYYSSFEFNEGNIVLYITYDKPSGGMRVSIDYVDRINSIKKEDKDMEDL